MSCPRSRSRNGCFAVSDSSSGIERVVATERQLGVDPLLGRDEPQLLEPVDLGAGEVLVGEIRERIAAPETKCRVERRERLGRPALGVRPPALFEQALEAVDVDRASGSTSRT